MGWRIVGYGFGAVMMGVCCTPFRRWWCWWWWCVGLDCVVVWHWTKHTYVHTNARTHSTSTQCFFRRIFRHVCVLLSVWLFTLNMFCWWVWFWLVYSLVWSATYGSDIVLLWRSRPAAQGSIVRQSDRVDIVMPFRIESIGYTIQQCDRNLVWYEFKLNWSWKWLLTGFVCWRNQCTNNVRNR